MTKLEELKAAYKAAEADAFDAIAAAWADYDDAYTAELNKTQEEKQND